MAWGFNASICELWVKPVAENLRRMVELLESCDAHDVVVIPEAARSG